MRTLYGGQLGIAGGIEADRVQCTERECRNRSIAIHQPGMFYYGSSSAVDGNRDRVFIRYENELIMEHSVQM